MYLLRRKCRLMCVISPMFIDSHNVSQNPVTIDLFEVSLDTSDHSTEDEQSSEGQGEALQTAAEQQDEDMLQLALILSASIETAQDEQRRREEGQQQQQALQSEGEKEDDFKLLCSAMESSTLLDLSENDQEKEKLKIFEQQHSLEMFYKDKQRRQEEYEQKRRQEEQEAAADMLPPCSSFSKRWAY